MELFADFLSKIDNPDYRERTEELLKWIPEKFPHLAPVVKWNQPMFTDHDTFIIGFSVAKHHLAVAPERAAMIHFANDIEASRYDHTKELIRIKWNQPVDYGLLEKMIEFNIVDKADCSTFWRK
ncbi:iron chaperone [Gracilibacillus salinarum]|uniref:Iron chaperone n=1 Tax=Gracilibacillus salinarum TaxID=2932255 RepID=A0ABY4GKB3_9BACI|nr:iron chaperone [Gracilibacillus salinarum]UOQ84806.1 iron chaperone [Gracilibacillus salinarum]